MQRIEKSQAMTPIRPYQENRTYGLFNKVCKIIYWSTGTNFWFEDLDYPVKLMKIYDAISRAFEVSVIIFLIILWGAFWTQSNLTETQSNDRLLFPTAHLVIYFVYLSVIYNKVKLRQLVRTVTVTLKEVCDDELIEKMMFKTTFRYLSGLVFVSSSTLIAHGTQAGIAAITTNATFTTVIPAWPDVEDRRLIAGAARFVHYILWWIFVVRFIAIYFIILTITIGLTHQFKNLSKYFEDLNNIFDGSGSQEEKERRYENALKVGIKMHSITLWCIQETLSAGGVAFSGQVIINVNVLLVLMLQMMSMERTFIAAMPIVFTASGVLVSTGVFMWAAGDVTVEASRLPTAMFHSGWYNCTRQSSMRVRKLVTIAIARAQDPVVIKGLGVIELSYASYVTIVKSSYSLFSVIY